MGTDCRAVPNALRNHDPGNGSFSLAVRLADCQEAAIAIASVDPTLALVGTPHQLSRFVHLHLALHASLFRLVALSRSGIARELSK